MAPVVYLSLADVIALHALIMDRTGYLPAPLRGEGLLESAIMRPQMAAHYEQADLIRQAVLLAVGISQVQAFGDSNKRTAYAALDVFLRLNDCLYGGDPVTLARQLELVAEREENLELATQRFEEWLRPHVQLPPG